jgi:hypothetical protein
MHANPLIGSKTLSGVSWKPVHLGQKNLSDPYIFDFVDQQMIIIKQNIRNFVIQ